MKDTDDLQWFGLRPIDDEVGACWKEAMTPVGEILADVAYARIFCQSSNAGLKMVQDPSGSPDAVIRHVFPYFLKIMPGDRSEDKAFHLAPRRVAEPLRRMQANVAGPSTNSPRSACLAP